MAPSAHDADLELDAHPLLAAETALAAGIDQIGATAERGTKW